MLVIGLPLLGAWTSHPREWNMYTMEQTMQAICCHWQAHLCRPKEDMDAMVCITRDNAPSRGRALASAGLAGNHWGMP